MYQPHLKKYQPILVLYYSIFDLFAYVYPNLKDSKLKNFY